MTTAQSRLGRRSFCHWLGASFVLTLLAHGEAMAQTETSQKVRAGRVEVSGARLYYETRGSGPVMVLIPGASGSGDSYLRLAQYLAQRYTVITYDRRGFSRSELEGPQDYAHRLEIDADDVQSLIKHVTREPAIVFGSSSGAIIALEVLIRHPNTVSICIPDEPPAMKLLPDGRQQIDFFLSLYEIYRKSGSEKALQTFREEEFAKSDQQAMEHAPKNKYAIANTAYWFEHELRQYPAVDLNLDALRAHANRILLVAGRESRGFPTHRVSVELAKILNRNLIELPGGHLGFLTQSADFARGLKDALKTIGHS